MIKSELNKLKETDIYSMALFILYNLTNIPEYSTLGELPYLLDKDALLNFCKYYGGLTIKVPTIQELDTIMHTLLIYEDVNISGNSLESSLEKYGQTVSNKKLLAVYKKMCEVLDKYEFKPRTTLE